MSKHHWAGTRTRPGITTLVCSRCNRELDILTEDEPSHAAAAEMTDCLASGLPSMTSPRCNLTERECCHLLASTIGGLVAMSNIETVHRAIKYLAEEDEIWRVVARQMKATGRLTQEIIEGLM